jgi:hypothetical protein
MRRTQFIHAQVHRLGRGGRGGHGLRTPEEDGDYISDGILLWGSVHHNLLGIPRSICYRMKSVFQRHCPGAVPRR